MEGSLAILEGNFDKVPRKKCIFSSRDNVFVVFGRDFIEFITDKTDTVAGYHPSDVAWYTRGNTGVF